MIHPLNPYVAGSSLRGADGFFGRQDILDSVSQELHNLGTNAIVLHGQRRIGKTTLLLQLENTLSPENFVPIYFDLQDQATRPLKRVLADLANAIARKVKFEPNDLNIMSDEGLFFQDIFIPRIYEQLAEGQRLIFLFDEFDVLDQLTQEELPDEAAARELFPFLRSLMNKDTRSVYVFAIGRQVEDLSLDFTATFKASIDKEIWVLDRSSAEALIRQAEDNGTLSYSNEAIERIISLTNGHPYFTQLLCQRIWERAYTRKPATSPRIEIADVNAAINDTLGAGENALIWLWNGLNPAQKIFAAALAEAAGGDSRVITEAQVVQVLANHAGRVRTHEVESAPKYLVKQRILDEVNKRQYRFAIELFLRWVQQKKPLRDVKKELDRVNLLAHQLFEVGHQHYQNHAWEDASRYFMDALKADPRHIQARIHLGDVYLQLSRPNDAVIELEQAYEFDPDEAHLPLTRALIERAESKEKAGDDNAALDDCEQVVKILPQEYAALAIKNRILIRRGVAALEQNHIDQAWEHFSQAGISDWQNAIEPIRRVVQGDPSLYHARLFLGVKLLELERVDEARSELDAALLTIYEKPGMEQEEEITKYFRDILDENPHQTFIRQRHGEVLLRLGRVAQAVDELEQVYRKSPDSASARQSLSEAIMAQIQLARKNKDWSRVFASCKRFAQIASANPGELETMAEIVTELQENLMVAQPRQYNKSQLNELLYRATSEIKILGVVALETDWPLLAQKLPPTILSNPDFDLTILCESDNILFSRALTVDIETAKKRQSFRQLQFIRDRALVDFPESLHKTGVSVERVKIEIMHLTIPISIVQVDGQIFANLWLSEGNEYFDEITPSHSWYEQIQNYIGYYFDLERGRKYACRKEDEVLELFDHMRIPRGIYPRNSFYDTDYDQLVVWGFIFDRQGRLLIHRRADNAKDNQGMWDKSVGGHTDLADFDTSKAIPREVIEELFSEELKQHKSDFTAFAISDEDMVFMGEWRPEQRKWHPFDEIKMFTREWAYFRLREDQRLYSPRILPNGKERRLRVIADVFLFLAGPQLTDESLGELKNSTFKLVELAALKVAMDKSLRKENATGFDKELFPKFSPDLVNVMTGKLRDVLDEYSQYIKKYLK